MSLPTAHEIDPLGAFVASTRMLAALLEDLDPETLDRGIQRQLDAFESVKSAVSMGALEQSADLARAIDEAGQVFGAVSRRQQEIHAELDDLRFARARTLRRLGSGETAKFVSRRV